MNDTSLIAWLVDLVIACALIEAAALLCYRQATGKGVHARDFLLNMLSGMCLMLALRAGVRDAGVVWVAMFLLGAGVAHGIDILLRWRRAGDALDLPATVRGTKVLQ